MMTHQHTTTSRLTTWLGYLAHPLHWFVWLFYFQIVANAWGLQSCEWTESKEYFASFTLNILFFPLLLTVLAHRLGFIQSFALRTNKDKIIPLLGTMIFVFWSWRVAKENPCLHISMVRFLFGMFLCTILMTVLSGFLSFSMYACGIAMGVHYSISSTILHSYHHLAIPLVALVFIGVGSYYALRHHTRQEFILGLLIGLISQSIPIFIF